MKQVLYIIGCFVLFIPYLNAQVESNSTWQLTANLNPVIVGNLNASDVEFTGMEHNSYTTDGERTRILGGSWPAESVENPGRYIQYKVSPRPGNHFNVTSLSMFLFAAGGSNMKANVYYSTDPSFITRTQIGSTLSLSQTISTMPNITVNPSVIVPDGETFYLRVYPWYTSSSTGKYVVTKSVVISGTTTNITEPRIYLNAENLSLGNVVFRDTSKVLSYTIYGINLTSDITIQAPQDFQVSTDSINFGSFANLSPVSGTVAESKIFTRFIPSSANGTVSGEIFHSSGGASAKILYVDGVALTSEPTVQSTITFGNTDGRSINMYFSGGNGQRRIVVVRPVNPVNWLPTDGVTIGGVNSDYSLAIDQGAGNKVIYDGTGTKGPVTGLTPNTTYHIAVFEYNVASGNSQNYLTTSPGTAVQTTPVAPSLIVSKATLSFGIVLKDSSSQEKTFTLSGTDLEPAEGNILIIAPAGFALSTSSGNGFTSSINIPYSGSTLNSVNLYSKFQPAEIKQYSDTIKISGGGTSVNLIVTGSGVSELPPPMAMIGYATVSAEGYSTTTGGAGGSVTTVSTLSELQAFASSCEKNYSPKILYINGKISAPSTTVVTIKHGANISILGINSSAELENVGLNIWDYNNVIIRNLKIHEVFYPNDAITINACHHVWIDHNELYSRIGPGIGVDTYDGLLDIKEGSRYITVSWNYLHHHMKCSLIGHTDDLGQQATDSQMRITYHHNWFSYTDGRNPSIRFGAIHMFNNYFEEISDYGIAARVGAHAKLENNHYHNVILPISTDKFPVSGLPNGYICETGNIFTGSCGANVISQTGCDFWTPVTLPYSYSLDPVESVESIVKQNAGVGIVTAIYEPKQKIIPLTFMLEQNYPNPFNPTTIIRYQLSAVSNVNLKIYDLLGREVVTLVNKQQSAGQYSVEWKASNYPSGVYFYRLQSGNHSITKKLILAK